MMKRSNILRYLIASAAGLLIALIVILVKSVFSMTDYREIMRALSDAFFVAGVLLTAAGIVLVASNGGVFTMISYGVRLMFSVMFIRDMNKRKYKDYYEYKVAREEKKISFAYLLFVGLAHLAIAAIFLVLFYS